MNGKFLSLFAGALLLTGSVGALAQTAPNAQEESSNPVPVAEQVTAPNAQEEGLNPVPVAEQITAPGPVPPELAARNAAPAFHEANQPPIHAALPRSANPADMADAAETTNAAAYALVSSPTLPCAPAYCPVTRTSVAALSHQQYRN